MLVKSDKTKAYFIVDPPFPIRPPHELFGTTSLTFDLVSTSLLSSTCKCQRKELQEKSNEAQTK